MCSCKVREGLFLSLVQGKRARSNRLTLTPPTFAPVAYRTHGDRNHWDSSRSVYAGDVKWPCSFLEEPDFHFDSPPFLDLRLVFRAQSISKSISTTSWSPQRCTNALMNRDLAAKPLYDQSTFWGRLRHFIRVTDPRTLLISDTELQESKKIIEDFQRTKRVPSEGVDRLWSAQYSTDDFCPPLALSHTLNMV